MHSAKKRMVREWDREWGKMETEGNLWYLGSVRAHWELVMGTNDWTWFREYLVLSVGSKH